jgi:hypothetical protein
MMMVMGGVNARGSNYRYYYGDYLARLSYSSHWYLVSRQVNGGRIRLCMLDFQYGNFAASRCICIATPRVAITANLR